MGRFYGIKIQNGYMTIKEVPKLWENSTKKWLKENIIQ